MEILKLFAEYGGFSGMVSAVLLYFLYKLGNRYISWLKEFGNKLLAINQDHAKATNHLADSVSDLANGLKKNQDKVIDKIEAMEKKILEAIKS